MYHNWSEIEENMLLGVPKVVGWLVWMGLMSAFQIRCEILEKQILSLFCWHSVGVNECSFPKFVSFAVGFGDSLAQGSEELWCSRNLCLSGSDFWHFSGPRCGRIMAFPKFVSFCIQKCSNFILWVSFLARVVNWNRMLNFVPF